MNKILITQSRQKKPITFDIKNYCISSICLNEKIKVLKNFCLRCTVVDNIEPYMRKETVVINKEFISFKDGALIVFITELDWQALNILYSLYNSSEKEEILKEVRSYNEIKKLDLISYYDALDKHKKISLQFRRNFIKGLEFFNVNKLLREFEKRNIPAEIHHNKVIVTFNNIKVGIDSEGVMNYNSIIVFIKRFTIDGFILRFDNFDYNSYWKIPIMLHPYLSVPYGFNNCLEFLPANNYSMFVDAIISLVKDYEISGGYAKVSDIIQDFQDLRILWNENKLRIDNRLDLSKNIMKQKSEL